MKNNTQLNNNDKFFVRIERTRLKNIIKNDKKTKIIISLDEDNDKVKFKVEENVEDIQLNTQLSRSKGSKYCKIKLEKCKLKNINFINSPKKDDGNSETKIENIQTNFVQSYEKNENHDDAAKNVNAHSKAEILDKDFVFDEKDPKANEKCESEALDMPNNSLENKSRYRKRSARIKDRLNITTEYESELIPRKLRLRNIQNVSYEEIDDDKYFKDEEDDDDDDNMVNEEQIFENCESDIEKINDNDSNFKNKRNFQCSICKKILKTAQTLERHKQTHTGISPYECLVCHKTYTKKFSLTVHERIHTKEKPFKCHKCDEKFTRKDSLQLHELKHTNKKHFVCKICDVNLSSKSILQRHLLIHADSKPHKCNICNKRFLRSYDTREHEKLHLTKIE